MKDSKGRNLGDRLQVGLMDNLGNKYLKRDETDYIAIQVKGCVNKKRLNERRRELNEEMRNF